MAYAKHRWFWRLHIHTGMACPTSTPPTPVSVELSNSAFLIGWMFLSCTTRPEFRLMPSRLWKTNSTNASFHPRIPCTPLTMHPAWDVMTAHMTTQSTIRHVLNDVLFHMWEQQVLLSSQSHFISLLYVYIDRFSEHKLRCRQLCASNSSLDGVWCMRMCASRGQPFWMPASFGKSVRCIPALIFVGRYYLVKRRIHLTLALSAESRFTTHISTRGEAAKELCSIY